ncbi:alpha/beta hydrolase [Neobacillus massiliamazoniensis]|uniref:Carbohydrate esterase, family 1 n=1 Tax=Neobacillus massiliamazoniensis TaxID=1499688 RepID=A0A0U1NVL7_9BACI|nr:alpha/beta hydrolase-fold protein [Neobacillus massiliamazoniensis]CRK82069.1 carbohydrate esterase, family 1 [Neobacillus massiliamazoniensis]
MLEKFQVYMTAFNQERRITVYLPKSYNQYERHYPVLYMHDGQNVFEDEDSIRGTSLGLKDYLDEIDLEIIVVGIDLNTTGEERVNEYCPWINGKLSKKILGYESPTGGKGEAYLDFIVHELKPLIDQKYRTLKDHTSMAGISLGGLITTYAVCRYPKIFKRAAAISPAYYRNQEEIVKFIKSVDLIAVERFYMDCGTKEAGKEEEISKIFLDLSSEVYKILKGKIKNTKFHIIEDAEHDYAFFKKRIPEIMSFLFL